jgi:hypothetical protein
LNRAPENSKLRPLAEIHFSAQEIQNLQQGVVPVVKKRLITGENVRRAFGLAACILPQ